MFFLVRFNLTTLAEWHWFSSHNIDDSMKYIGWIGCLLSVLLTTKVNIDITRFDDHFICIDSELRWLDCKNQLDIYEK